MLLTTPAWAQDTATDSPAATTSKDDDAELVVTGTLIRGIAPGGSQTIGVDEEKILSTGAVTTADLIASVPQAGSFLAFVGIRGSTNFSLAVNRPTLRYLGNISSSTNSTLVLLDGHRLPGMGILQSTADLDAIAPGAIERVEIVTDGGSSTYGSDAVGGVMNFITRKRFDGLEVKGSYGFADDYTQYGAGVTAGHSWGDVSAYVSYDFSKHDSLYGIDRDWSQNRDWVNNVGANLDCVVGNVRASNITYALPGLAAGLGNRCDLSEQQTLYPRERKHSVLASVVLDPGGPVSFSLKGYYVNRKNVSDGGPLSAPSGVTVPSTSPFFIPLPGAPTSEVFFFNFTPVFGEHARQSTSMESYGITPSMEVDVGGGWRLNALANYGIGKAQFVGELVNLTPIAAAAGAGTFNPANLSAATNAAPLATARNWFQFGRAQHDMMNARAVLEGPLFALPAGKVRAAVGVEYLYEAYAGNNSRGVTAAQLAALTDRKANRSVSSAFGEIYVPVLGEETGGLHNLSVTVSGRYDKYSDFGSTFNPKVGVNLEPVDWFKLRGNWGKAFQAPGISDIALGGAPSWNILPIAVRPFTNPALPANGRTNLLTLAGTKLPLEPQTAKTWSLGFDLQPPIIDGLSLGLTYYNVDFKGAISIPPIFLPARFYADFPDNYVTYDEGGAALLAYFNELTAEGAANGATTLASLPGGNLDSVYGILDSRTQNLARVKTSGLDFYTRLRHETGFGDIYGDVSGNYILTFKQQSNPAANLISTIGADMTRLRVTTTVGAHIGNFQAQVMWNYSQGFATLPTVANLQQNRVAAFNVFNLFFQYDVPGESALLKDLSFTLNVDNVFDQDPPLFRGAVNSFVGVTNGFTLGRLIRVGVRKRF